MIRHRDDAQPLPAGAEAQRGASGGLVRTGPDRLDARGVKVLQRVEQRLLAEVQRVVVREGHGVDPHAGQTPRGERRRAEEEPLAGLREGDPAVRDAALQVEQEQVRLGGRRHDVRREQRRRGITGQPLRDPAAEHRVTGKGDREHVRRPPPAGGGYRFAYSLISPKSTNTHASSPVTSASWPGGIATAWPAVISAVVPSSMKIVIRPDRQ